MPENPFLKNLRQQVSAIPLPHLIEPYRRAKQFIQNDVVTRALHQKWWEKGRLNLAQIEPESLSPDTGSVLFPFRYPMLAGEDAPLVDILFLLNLAKGLGARSILEVGTYRARTTLAFHLNCPQARLVSYDIQVLDSPFRTQLQGSPLVDLRHASFAASGSALRREEPFDLIFIDGSHQVQHVIEDSFLAFDLVSPRGVIVWHDYRYNGWSTRELRVPEALDQIVSPDRPIWEVKGTTCAIYVQDAAQRSRLSQQLGRRRD